MWISLAHKKSRPGLRSPEYFSKGLWDYNLKSGKCPPLITKHAKYSGVQGRKHDSLTSKVPEETLQFTRQDSMDV